MSISKLASEQKRLPLTNEENSEGLISKSSISELDFLSVAEGRRVEPENRTRVVQRRLSKEVLVRTYNAQKTMLKIAYQTYKKSIGTKNEDVMRKMYNDSVIDFNEFVNRYKKELLN